MKAAKLLSTALAGAALMAGLSQNAQAEIVTVVGDTVGSPTFNRPVENLAGLSNIGTNVSYDTFSFKVDDDAIYSIVASTTGWDAFLALYEYSFDPSKPLFNAVEAGDDLISLNTAGLAVELLANRTYIVAVTSYNNNVTGDYHLTIAGPGAITAVSAVPEPTSWLMMGLGLAAVGYAARRKQQA